jgi:predicted metal-dependent hydrolase
MTETIELGDVHITLVRKDVKHVHLTVHPPLGRVTLVAPHPTRTEVARAYAITRLAWIREQRSRLQAQARETPRQFVTRESHHLWGRRYLLRVEETAERPGVHLSHRQITLRLRPDTPTDKRAQLMHDWHRSELHRVVPELIRRWEVRLGVQVQAYFLQRMKTQWGSCNPTRRHIRLNTELVKKPKDLLEYVVVHEMAHLLEASHNERFVAVLDQHWPQWRESRAELNALPLVWEDWDVQVP